MTWHQFRASKGEPFGFLCMVERRAGQAAASTEDELARLMADPVVAAFRNCG